MIVEIEKPFSVTGFYTAFKRPFPKDHFFKGEAHNFWEIVIVASGEIGVTAGRDVFKLKAGQAVLHEPMEFHRVWSENGTNPELIIISFTAKNMPDYSNKVFLACNVGKIDEILNHLRLGFKAEDIYLKSVCENPFITEKAVKEFELFLLETISENLTFKGAKKRSLSAKKYAVIIDVLEKNVEKRLTVSQIAKMCLMSEISLQKTFSKYSDMGVIEYFNRLKITAAISLLRNGETVDSVAEKLGFSSRNYFSAVFKRITGENPSKYK